MEAANSYLANFDRNSLAANFQLCFDFNFLQGAFTLFLALNPKHNYLNRAAL